MLSLRSMTRPLLRRPLSAILAAVSLGIGMSLATLVYVMLDRTILREPFPGAKNVLQVTELDQRHGTTSTIISPRHLTAMRASPADLVNVAGLFVRSDDAILGSSGEAGTVPAISVTTNFFDVLGARPLMGRTFNLDDANDGARPLVLSYMLWQSRFGADPAIVGRTIIVNGTPSPVVGVMPEGLDYPEGTRLWMYVAQPASALRVTGKLADFGAYRVLARVAPGASATRAQASLIRAVQVSNADVGAQEVETPKFQTVAAALRADARERITIWVAVAFVILALCAVNFATVSLARGMRRRGEVAVRAALGASRAQLSAMFLIEAALVAAAAGVIAVLLAFWLGGFTGALGGEDGVATGAGLALRLVAFGVLGTVVVGIIFALAPSIQLGDADLRSHLAGDGASVSGGRSIVRSRSLLVACQLMLAVLCVASIVALVSAERRAGRLGPGYDFEHIVTATLLVPDSATRMTGSQPLLDFVRRVPGVTAAALQRDPLAGPAALVTPEINRKWAAGNNWWDVSPTYFATLGVRPIAGRLPTDEEIAGHAPVAVLSKSITGNFHGVDPVGQRVSIQRSLRSPAEWVTVVGIVPDIRRGPRFYKYDLPIYTFKSLPLDRATTRLYVRVQGDARASLVALRAAFRGYDPGVVVADLRTVSDQVDEFQRRQNGQAAFLATVIAIALVLAALGVYGLASYTAQGRAKEIGIRQALGATTVSAARLVLGELTAQALVGSLIGMFAASRFVQVLDALIRDPRLEAYPTIRFPFLPTAASAILLLVAAFAAGFIPIRRVAKQDIVQALR